MKFVEILKSPFRYKVAAGMLCAAMVTGCSDDYFIEKGSSGLPFTFVAQLQQQNLTRANDYGFVDGDRMGIYIVDYVNGTAGILSATDNRASNVLFTFVEATPAWTSATTLYWKDKTTPVDVYGYYPGVNVVNDPASYELEVSYKQNVQPEEGEISNYEASDFLWGKVTKVSPTTNAIVVPYSHRMACVSVQLKAGEGITATEWEKVEKSVQVDNTLRRAVIDLHKGTPVATGSTDKSILMLPQSGDQYRAIVVPQTVAGGKSLLTITVDGQDYAHQLSADMNYESGKMHNFTITVAKKTPTGDYDFTVSYDGISPWSNDESSHRFSANSYVTIHCPEAGKLRESIAAAGYDCQTIKNLKVTGKLTVEDFELLRGQEMPELTHLNLHDAKMKHCIYYEGWWDHYNNDYDLYMDNMLPKGAFYQNKNIRSVVLPSQLERIGNNAFRETKLMYSTLQIPEGVTYIEEHAFAYNGEDNQVELILPNSLDTISAAAFYDCCYSCELNLSDNIRFIGASAFGRTPKFHGTFHIPSKLKSIEGEAFYSMGSNGSFTGEIEIPQGVSTIGERGISVALKNRIALSLPEGVKKLENACFGGVRLSSLHLNDDLEEIQYEAFYNASLPFSITLPSKLVTIGVRAFYNCGIEGELVIPESSLNLSGGCFLQNQITKLTLPSKLEQIPGDAFAENKLLTEVTIPKYVDYIESYAFGGCEAMQTVICLNPDPPRIEQNTFSGLYFDKVVLQVPEASIEQYRHADHWKQFQNITAYHELAYNVPEIKTLDKGITRTGIIRAEGDWEVSECPDWVTVTPMQGSHKAEVSITVAAQSQPAATREGRVVFRLKGKDYTTYTTVRQVSASVAEDETIVLQEASVAGAKPIPLFIVGDGYDADEIASGKYLEEIKEQMEHFFSIEPYKTYRNYFTVSTAIACSPQSGVDGDTKFDTKNYTTSITCQPQSVMGGNGLHGNTQRVWQYAVEHGKDISQEREGQTTILVLLNTSCISNNTTNYEENGRTVTWMGKSTDSYPFNQQGYVLHELGGRAFGKLGPEEVCHLTFISACTCPSCNMLSQYYEAQRLGWWQNVSLSAKMGDLPWNHLIFHEKYAPYVDVYEGAVRHSRGAYRSENVSVMGNSYIPYYNTISRELIVRRIMECAGKEFSFDDFVANDKIEIP